MNGRDTGLNLTPMVPRQVLELLIADIAELREDLALDPSWPSNMPTETEGRPNFSNCSMLIAVSRIWSSFASAKMSIDLSV